MSVLYFNTNIPHWIKPLLRYPIARLYIAFIADILSYDIYRLLDFLYIGILKAPIFRSLVIITFYRFVPMCGFFYIALFVRLVLAILAVLLFVRLLHLLPL